MPEKQSTETKQLTKKSMVLRGQRNVFFLKMNRKKALHATTSMQVPKRDVTFSEQIFSQYLVKSADQFKSALD